MIVEAFLYLIVGVWLSLCHNLKSARIPFSIFLLFQIYFSLRLDSMSLKLSLVTINVLEMAIFLYISQLFPVGLKLLNTSKLPRIKLIFWVLLTTSAFGMFLTSAFKRNLSISNYEKFEFGSFHTGLNLLIFCILALSIMNIKESK